jgi:acyl dehydratase
MTAMWFEDFEVGAVFETAARTITEADVVAFAGISGDYNPLHTDAQFARGTVFGERIAHGLLVLSIASGLGIQTGMFTGTNLAFLGIEDWRFVGVVLFGDTIRLRSTVSEVRLTSKGDRGIIKLAQEIVNQRDEVVQKGVFVSLMAAREAAPGGAGS